MRAVLQWLQGGATAVLIQGFDMTIFHRRRPAPARTRPRPSLVIWYSPHRALWLGREMTVTPRQST